MANEVRQSQNRRGWDNALLGLALDEPTVRSRQKRFASGDLPIVERNATAAPTALAASRLLLQSEQVAAQVQLVKPVAGPGTVD